MTHVATARDVTTGSDRLSLLVRSVAAAPGYAQTAATPTPVTAQAEMTAPAAIRPFRVNIAEDALVAELRAAFRSLR